MAPGPRDAAIALLLAVAFFFIIAIPMQGAPLWVSTLGIEAGFVAAAAVVIAGRRLSWRESLALRPFTLAQMALTVVGAAALHQILRTAEPLVMEVLRFLRLDFEAQVKAFEEQIRSELARRYLATVFAVSLLPAIAEEALFRGVVMSGWRALGPIAAVALTALAFGAVHVLPIRIVLTFVLGVWFGLVVAWSGSLWCGVAAHAVNNAMALVLEAHRDWPTLVAVPVLGACAWGLYRGALKSGGGGSGGASV